MIRTKSVKIHSIRSESAAFRLFGYTGAILYSLIVILPLLFVLFSSMKNNPAIFQSPLGLPKSLNFANFASALNEAKLIRALSISLFITLGAEILTVLLIFPASYAITRIKTRLAPAMEMLMAMGFLIPSLPLLVSTYLLAAKFGLLYKPIMLILFYPAVKLPFSILLLSSFMRKVPLSLEESAEIDGANRWKMMLHIFFPLAMPGLVTLIILNFIDFWNEYLFALIILNTENRTAQIAISSLKSIRTTDYGLLSAGAVIVTIPVIIIFIVFQERIMSSMLNGAIKE